jgi:hypothetical protein
MSRSLCALVASQYAVQHVWQYHCVRPMSSTQAMNHGCSAWPRTPGGVRLPAEGPTPRCAKLCCCVLHGKHTAHRIQRSMTLCFVACRDAPDAVAFGPRWRS